MGVNIREKDPGSGVWWIFIAHKNKRRSMKVGSRSAANRLKREVEEQLALGKMDLDRAGCPTLSEYGRKWLNSPSHGWSKTTQIQYDGAFQLYLKPAFGDKKLSSIKRLDAKNLIAELSLRELSSSRIRLVHMVLNQILNSAIEDEILSSNPCTRVFKYQGSAQPDPLTAEETILFLEEAKKKYPHMLYVLFLLAVRTGLRIGEILALEWSDIDFKERTVSITKAWDYYKKELKPPKSKKSRKVDLTPMVIEALKQIRASDKIFKVSGAIFVNQDNERLAYSTIRDKFKLIIPRPVRIHDLRHTYASLRVNKGDNILDVSRQLGHSDAGFTLKVYAHWMPGEHQIQVDELDALQT
jgi:integrase